MACVGSGAVPSWFGKKKNELPCERHTSRLTFEPCVEPFIMCPAKLVGPLNQRTSSDLPYRGTTATTVGRSRCQVEKGAPFFNTSTSVSSGKNGKITYLSEMAKSCTIPAHGALNQTSCLSFPSG